MESDPQTLIKCNINYEQLSAALRNHIEFNLQKEKTHDDQDEPTVIALQTLKSLI